MMYKISFPQKLIDADMDFSILTNQEKEELSYNFEALDNRLVDHFLIQDEKTRCGSLVLYKHIRRVHDFRISQQNIQGGLNNKVLIYFRTIEPSKQILFEI